MSIPFILKAVRIEIIKIQQGIHTKNTPDETYHALTELTNQLDDMIKDSEGCPPPKEQ